MIVRAVVGWQGGRGPHYLAEIPTTRVNPPFVPGWIATAETMCSRITQFSMDQRKGDAPSTAMSFQRKSGSGWIGTWLSGGWGIQELLGPAGEWSSGGGGGQKVSNLSLCCKRQIFRDNPSFCASRTLRFRVWCQTERFIGREWNESRLAFTCRSVRSRAAAISIRRGLRAKKIC